jgi:hypothetical protein
MTEEEKELIIRYGDARELCALAIYTNLDLEKEQEKLYQLETELGLYSTDEGRTYE